MAAIVYSLKQGDKNRGPCNSWQITSEVNYIKLTFTFSPFPCLRRFGKSFHRSVCAVVPLIQILTSSPEYPQEFSTGQTFAILAAWTSCWIRLTKFSSHFWSLIPKISTNEETRQNSESSRRKESFLPVNNCTIIFFSQVFHAFLESGLLGRSRHNFADVYLNTSDWRKLCCKTCYTATEREQRERMMTCL